MRRLHEAIREHDRAQATTDEDVPPEDPAEWGVMDILMAGAAVFMIVFAVVCWRLAQ